MKRVCAWCDSNLNPQSASTDEPDRPVSHGICARCLSVQFGSHYRTTMREVLDRLSAPVLLVGKEPRVMTANLSAKNMLDKEYDEIDQRLGGEVFDCVYALNGQTCGKSEHCQSCTVRNSVNSTFATGIAESNIPVRIDLEHGGDPGPWSLRITTEKVGEFVLLKIDEMHPE